MVCSPAATLRMFSMRELRCPRSIWPRCVKWMPIWTAATSWLHPSSNRLARTRAPNDATAALIGGLSSGIVCSTYV